MNQHQDMEACRSSKIVVVSTGHNAMDARILYRQAIAAAKAGFKVVVIANHPRRETYCGVSIVPFRRPASRLLRYMSAWWLALRAYLQKGDIYHFHDPELLPPMVLVKLLSGRPVIYDCHEFHDGLLKHGDWIPSFMRALAANMWLAMQRTCSKVLGLVIVVVEEQKRMFPSSISFLTMPNRLPLLPHLEKVQTENRPYDLVHLGGIYQLLGSDTLVEMVRILVNELGQSYLKVLIVGRVGPGFLQTLSEAGVRAHVDYAGVVPFEQVHRELLTSKIGLVVRHIQQDDFTRYSFSTKIFDYMAAGLPIICGDRECLRHVDPRGEAIIFVDASQPRLCAEAALKLLNDEELRIHMGKNARKLFMEKHRGEADATRLIEYYKLMIERHKN